MVKEAVAKLKKRDKHPVISEWVQGGILMGILTVWGLLFAGLAKWLMGD